MLQTLALIPARAGSKSIPNKNVVEVDKHPLIAHSIKSAKDTRLIHRTLVSTDSVAIKDISIKSGAEVPFLRSALLAQDETPDLPVFVNCLNLVD